MLNSLKRKQRRSYKDERTRLLECLQTLSPTCDEYHTVMQRVNELDKILKRGSDRFRAVAGVVGPSVAIVGVYGIQQFGGILVPKALETYAARQDAKNPPKELE